MKRCFGCHVSAAGGLEQALKRGEALGANTIQIHPSPPQRWNPKPFDEGFEAGFVEGRAESSVEKVFFHAIYLINLATPDPNNFHLSKLSLVHYLDLLSRTRGDGVIVHVGSNKDQEEELEGLRRVSQGINWVLAEMQSDCRLLLEVAAGSGNVIGSRMEQLARVFEMIEAKERVGFALDSQHLWASGYDLVSDLNGIVDAASQTFGLEKIWAIHLNDSKSELGSKRDRHENLGEGLIGLAALSRFVNHPRLKAIPVILETPNLKDMDTAAEEMGKLRRIIEE